jgi:hypothetical protein
MKKTGIILTTAFARKAFISIEMLAILFFANCAAPKKIFVYSCYYDKKCDQTSYYLPSDTVYFQGKWEKTGIGYIDNRQFFENKKGITIEIQRGTRDEFKFKSDNYKEVFDFIRAYYEWYSEYYVNNYGADVYGIPQLQHNLIEENEISKYIIWRFYGDFHDGYNDKHIDTYMLFGEKQRLIYTYSILATDEWTVEQKLDFLKELHLNKEKCKNR